MCKDRYKSITLAFLYFIHMVSALSRSLKYLAYIGQVCDIFTCGGQDKAKMIRTDIIKTGKKRKIMGGGGRDGRNGGKTRRSNVNITMIIDFVL